MFDACAQFLDPSQAIIGKAEINRDWCLAAKGMGCHECVDVCNYEAPELGADNAGGGRDAQRLWRLRAGVHLVVGRFHHGRRHRISAIVVRPTEEVEA